MKITELTRPIIGIENRTAREVFDIMCDRISATAALEAALSAIPASAGEECPCTLIEQDESCPVGYPSLLCSVCSGTGTATLEQIKALAAEMLNIASELGEPGDPFAAWETLSFIKTKLERLEGASAGEVKVRELEWHKRKNTKDEWADTDIGRYEVGIVNGGYIATRRYIDEGQWADDVFAEGLCAKREAKAAAQADYEARIRSALSPSAPVTEAVPVPVAWDCVAPDGGRYIIRTEGDQTPVGWASFSPLFASPPQDVRGLEAENERLRKAVAHLVESEFATQIRKLVSGWNGDGIPEEYRMDRHDDALGVTLPTNCGTIYMLDEVFTSLRAALKEAE